MGMPQLPGKERGERKPGRGPKRTEWEAKGRDNKRRTKITRGASEEAVIDQVETQRKTKRSSQKSELCTYTHTDTNTEIGRA